jgi:methylenetetrahydrofolate dehydrogenase (NAD+)
MATDKSRLPADSSPDSLTAHSKLSTMSDSQVPKTCKVVLADTIAKSLLSEVKGTLEKVQTVDGVKPCLIAFLANDDPAAVKYADWSKKTCEEK